MGKSPRIRAVPRGFQHSTRHGDRHSALPWHMRGRLWERARLWSPHQHPCQHYCQAPWAWRALGTRQTDALPALHLYSLAYWREAACARDINCCGRGTAAGCPKRGRHAAHVSVRLDANGARRTVDDVRGNLSHRTGASANTAGESDLVAARIAARPGAG